MDGMAILGRLTSRAAAFRSYTLAAVSMTTINSPRVSTAMWPLRASVRLPES
jgi:hypothetical protein